MERLLVCRKIPCYYFFLLILATMLEDCKESITKEKLFGATKIIMNSLDNHDFKEILQKSEIYLVFKYDDLESEFSLFKEKYKDLITIKDDVITLKKNVGYQELLDEMEIIEEDEGFYGFSYEIQITRKTKQMKAYLGLDYVRKAYLSLILKEKRLESLYQDLSLLDEEKDSRIKNLLALRNNLYKKLAMAGIHVVESLQDEEVESKIYLHDFPVDIDLYEKSEYYIEEDYLEGIYVPLEDNLYSSYQVAIFTSKDLAEVKLANDLTLVRMEIYNEDPEVIISEGEIAEKSFGIGYDSDIIFYLTYLNKLEELGSLYSVSDELESTKNRLIYVLDDSSLELYKEENREKVLKDKLASPDIEPIFDDGYKHFRNESLFLIEDLFEGKPESFLDNLKKVAFIATYYELSHDEMVKRVLTKYTNCPHYFEFYRFIASKVKVK